MFLCKVCITFVRLIKKTLFMRNRFQIPSVNNKFKLLGLAIIVWELVQYVKLVYFHVVANEHSAEILKHATEVGIMAGLWCQ